MKYEFNFRKNIKFFWLTASITFLSFLIIIFLWTKKIKESSYFNAQTYATLYTLLLDNRLDDNLRGILFKKIVEQNSLPIIVTDTNENILTWRNINIKQSSKNDSTAIIEVKAILKTLKKMNKPILLKTTFKNDSLILGKLYYGDYTTLQFATYLPLLLLGITLIFAYLSFTSIKILQENEKEKLFYGLAKETAHQLGTPISSLMGWIELLKIETGYDKEKRRSRRKADMYLEEMEKDIKRLVNINNRFELIGTQPSKKEENLGEVIAEVCNYFEKRLPNHIEIITTIDPNIPPIFINKTLIEWVFENLIKNSVDSLVQEEKGIIKITAQYNQKENEIVIDVTDNGKGIPENIKNYIFEPGFSTKKKGWGLGLTFVKRIIEVYHKGEMLLIESKPYIATTFRIKLFPHKLKDA